MIEQLRAFLSIDIDDDVLLDSISKIQQQLDITAAKMKLVEIENIHLTWRFFGDIKVTEAEQIFNSLQTLAFKPFDICLRGVGAFPNVRRPRVIWIGVTKGESLLLELKKTTDSLLSKMGYKKERKKFTPHATIARIRHIKDRVSISSNIQSIQDSEIGRMKVTKISMKKSTLTPKGPIYDTLWTVPC